MKGKAISSTPKVRIKRTIINNNNRASVGSGYDQKSEPATASPNERLAEFMKLRESVQVSIK